MGRDRQGVLGVDGDAELDYRGLAKWMVGPDATPFEASKPEVILKDAHLEEDVLHGYAYAHPKLGEGRLRTSTVLDITYDARATARVETKPPRSRVASTSVVMASASRMPSTARRPTPSWLAVKFRK